MTTRTEQNSNVLLRGGPAENYAAHERELYVADPETKLKVFRGNRYDHFEATRETVHRADRELRVLEWSATTYVAE
ncbi:hypothetical protein HUT18_00690 [Streptomyces sp. NA04227]|uniref:DUF5988 family protein n=1 Tax=Streptomyces sp. NA04227 TaxID=2742136 RepID=UPI00159053D7|nr:DUF5988 family protein [Streptomyces sp. NA04227]QKW05093.1 hypothetical protein HUT18_00690 [Streptomyces sp. NA04227]